MRILVTADWHLDLWQRVSRDPFVDFSPVFDTLDALIIAGDLANNPLRNWPSALEQIGRLIDPAKVFIMLGNHDYYSFDLRDEDTLRSLVERAGMTFVQKSAFEVGGVRFLCATLWTDFALCGNPARAMAAAARNMNDYRMIRFGTRVATPQDTADIHKDHLAWLTEAIAVPFDGRTVVVTHHGPSPCATGSIDDITPAFTSNLDAWILRHRPDLWLFGHTHRRLQGRVGPTPIVNVSMGYPNEVPAGSEADILLRGLLDTTVRHLLLKDAGGLS